VSATESLKSGALLKYNASRTRNASFLENFEQADWKAVPVFLWAHYATNLKECTKHGSLRIGYLPRSSQSLARCTIFTRNYSALRQFAFYQEPAAS